MGQVIRVVPPILSETIREAIHSIQEKEKRERIIDCIEAYACRLLLNRGITKKGDTHER